VAGIPTSVKSEDKVGVLTRTTMQEMTKISAKTKMLYYQVAVSNLYKSVDKRIDTRPKSNYLLTAAFSSGYVSSFKGNDLMFVLATFLTIASPAKLK